MRVPGWALTWKWRRIAPFLLVTAVFTVVLVAALAYPRSLVHGDLRTGPRGSSHRGTVATSYVARVAWSGPQRDIVLTLLPKAPCRLRVVGVSSTAPQRLEVTLDQLGHDCVGARRTERFVLPHPAIWGPGQDVRILLGDRSLKLHWKPYRRR